LIFGAKRLPEVGRSMGKAFREFKKGVKEVKDDIDAGEDKKDEKKVGEE
ncbi:MAG TPA: twin-arginine translocase TatA/TatE family subunit, partial [Firmicutes bacterium]|nr:twin-arginine translocase TatA/TatE family subunit [Bacillota bacterium]